MIHFARSITDRNLPGAFFSNCASHSEFAPERRRYEVAVRTFAAETSPAALRAHVAALRQRGIRSTQAGARAAAAEALREALLSIGYTETEIKWHAARRGRRDRHLFADSMCSLGSVTEPPARGGWRGPYQRRH